jgi:acyl-CoA thioester hydrolase
MNIFELEMEVRDYECDLQGIVNNAIYQHYLEHARHRFLHSLNIDFAQLHREGLDAVATRIEMDFRQPLRPGDRFVVRVGARPEGRLRLLFEQTILHAKSREKILEAKVFAVLLENGRPVPPLIFTEALADWNQKA